MVMGMDPETVIRLAQEQGWRWDEDVFVDTTGQDRVPIGWAGMVETLLGGPDRGDELRGV